MTYPDEKFAHAGAPEPPPLPLVESSNVMPRGSAGLVNQGTNRTTELVAPVYNDLTSASVDSAMAKRESDWSSLMSGHTPAGGGEY